MKIFLPKAIIFLYCNPTIVLTEWEQTYLESRIKWIWIEK